MAQEVISVHAYCPSIVVEIVWSTREPCTAIEGVWIRMSAHTLQAQY